MTTRLMVTANSDVFIIIYRIRGPYRPIRSPAFKQGQSESSSASLTERRISDASAGRPRKDYGRSEFYNIHIDATIMDYLRKLGKTTCREVYRWQAGSMRQRTKRASRPQREKMTSRNRVVTIDVTRRRKSVKQRCQRPAS
jgi:hypothetical protein